MDRPTKVPRKLSSDATASSSAHAIKMSRASAAIAIAKVRQLTPFCSASALSAIVNMVQTTMPYLHRNIDRNMLREGRDAVCFEMTPYGPIHQEVSVQLTDNTFKQIEFQDPAAMLYKVCSTSMSFSLMLLRALDKHPNSQDQPWSLILYTDEVSPGNQMLQLNARKTWAFYWSILEFGPSVLSDEESWFEILLYRTTQTKCIKGGMSALFATVIKAFFNDSKHNMQTSGIYVQLCNGPRIRLFIKLRYMVADEAALHYSWGCKGSSGLKPCLKCDNVFNSKYATGPNSRNIIDSDHSNWAVTDKCLDTSKFVRSSKETILDIVDHLAAAKGTMSNGQFNAKATNLGWNYIPNGVLMDPICRPLVDPVEQTAFDHQHVFMVSGIFSIHLGFFMEFVTKLKITHAVFYKYCDAWNWPARMTATGVGAFCPERAKSSMRAGVFKSTASEARSITPVLGHYVNKTLMNSKDPTTRRHASSFMLLVEVVELLECVDRAPEAREQFRTSVVAYLKSFASVYGEENMVEKHHMALHVAEQIDRFGLGCYVLERKHKNIKKYSNEVVNTNSGWDRSVMREVTARHLAVMSHEQSVHYNVEPCLQNPGKCAKLLHAKLAAVFGHDAIINTSSTVRINEFERCSKGDVVLMLTEHGLLACHVKANISVHIDKLTNIYSLVHVWQLLEQHDRYSTWNTVDNAILCSSCDIVCACVWTRAGDIATVVHPKLIRL